MRRYEEKNSYSAKQCLEKLLMQQKRFMVVAMIAVGLVFHAGDAKNVLLKLFNKVIGA